MSEFIKILEQTGFPESSFERLERFYELHRKESSLQNLTTLTSEEDFVRKHLIDALELVKTGWLSDRPCIDWGSGGGFPGIPFQILNQERAPWILLDSEKRKVEFLERTLQALELQHTQALWSRIEELPSLLLERTLVVRAVGSLTKLLKVLEKCSTWNNLILLKGPKWEEELKEAAPYLKRKRIEIQSIHEYSIDQSQILRKLIHLKNVPRGTMN